MAVGWLSLLQSERVSEPAVCCALAGLCAATIVCCVPRHVLGVLLVGFVLRHDNARSTDTGW